jgi:hypothetical protein
LAPNHKRQSEPVWQPCTAAMARPVKHGRRSRGCHDRSPCTARVLRHSSPLLCTSTQASPLRAESAFPSANWLDALPNYSIRKSSKIAMTSERAITGI